ncbi:MAG: methionine adenosyltransferase [Clostridia bacterium]|nr:methionine adenosyltransferase [Clostridia bacterium]
MNEKTIRLVTAESVRAGHPDKFCDQIADAILDAHLAHDPAARVAVEVFVTEGKMIIGGEVTSQAEVDCGEIVAEVINRIGYSMRDLSDDPKGELKLEIRIHKQSPDIAAAVDKKQNIGAGDQGIMVGYATDETHECMPLPVMLAHRICRRLDELKPRCPWMGADGKAQVTVAYENDKPVAITALVISLQHGAEIDRKSIKRFIGKEVLSRVIPNELLKADTKILINPSGAFVLGGPAADTGLTGRKLAVDQYGPVAHIGGGALSGKDATKVDRSGAYAARWVAKNIVAAGMAKRCEVQIAYAIGRSEPVSIMVDTFGTGVISDSRIEAAVKEAFDLSPAAIIRDLCLDKPIYSGLSCYGHFGRMDLCAPWEVPNRKYDLLTAALKQDAQRFC